MPQNIIHDSTRTDRKPLISVLMPTYNVELYVREAVQSILEQTCTDFEFIIVDDCSSDRTFEILSELKKEDSRIKLLKNNTNSKICVTLNRAWNESKGDFIARMDGDDISAPNRLEVLLDFLNKNSDIDLVGSQVISIDEYGAVLSHKEYLRTPEYIKRGNKISPSVSHIWMARRNVYEKLGGYRNLPFAEDYDFLLRGENLGFRYANVENYLYKVRIRNGNTGSTYGLEQRKVKSFVQKINNNHEVLSDIDLINRYSEATSCKEDERRKFYAAQKHLSIAVKSRRNPFKLVFNVLLGMIQSKYIYNYIIDEIKFRAIIKQEDIRIPRKSD